MSQSTISTLLGSIENLLVDVFNGVANFIEAGIQELVNYAPTIVDIAIIGAVAVGIGYAFRQALVNVPFIGGIVNALGRLFRF